MPSLPGKQNPSFKHGFAGKNVKRSNIYRRWQHMIQRCHNPNDGDYANYGGRGIYVCDEWRYNFATFLADMGVPEKGYSLERSNNEGPYCKANCYWASPKQQANNKRNTKMLTINGITRPLSEWCSIAGIGSKTVLYRLKHRSMTHEEAVFTPLTWTKKVSTK